MAINVFYSNTKIHIFFQFRVQKYTFLTFFLKNPVTASYSILPIGLH